MYFIKAENVLEPNIAPHIIYKSAKCARTPSITNIIYQSEKCARTRPHPTTSITDVYTPPTPPRFSKTPAPHT